MRDRIRVGTQFKNITDRSFYNRKNAEDAGFHPIAMEKHNEETQMTDFVPKPLYTKKQLQEFRQKNIVDGRFVTDEQTIQSVEDLEKLLFCGRRKRRIPDRRIWYTSRVSSKESRGLFSQD